MKVHHATGTGPYERLLTEAEAIEALGLADRPNPAGALRWLVRRRALGVVRIGNHRRFRPSDIEDFIRRHHVPAAG